MPSKPLSVFRYTCNQYRFTEVRAEARLIAIDGHEARYVAKVADAFIVFGLVLFLLGLITGMAVPAMTNPRMGVASHLQGMTNGPFLILIGVLWPRVDLPHAWQVVTLVLLVYGTYANWLATQLGAVWGAGHRFAPGATGGHRASPVKEKVVDVLLATLAPAMVVATIALIVGVLR